MQRNQGLILVVFASLSLLLHAQPSTRIDQAQCDCGSTSVRTSGAGSGTISSVARTMTDIAVSLSRYTGRRVVDRTGLSGRFDAEITWSEDVSIFTAVQEQLGLKLESQRAPIDVGIIESVERPVEN